MKSARYAALLFATSLTACGGSSKHNPDASIQLDAPVDTKSIDAAPDAQVCIATALDMPDIKQAGTGAGSVAVWGGNVTTDLGDGGQSTYQLEFYDGGSFDFTQAADLSMGAQNNYATCQECVRVFSNDATGAEVREFFQSGGTMQLTANPVTGNLMMGTITDLAMVEVTIATDGSFTSTPVVGGKCLSLGTVTLNHDAVPNAYTCAHTTYGDGTNCDCMCGIPDPDCANGNDAVTGCTAATPVCPNNTCVVAPANDKCQAAHTLTVGTAVTGTTTNATNNYDLGLEQCDVDTTGNMYPQPGADVTYKVALAANTGYTFTLSGLDATFDGSISLLGAGTAAGICDASPVACLKGADAMGPGMDETFSFTTTAAGTYYVIVDSFDPPTDPTNPGGAFTIKVTSP